jgi:hypothetical protein
VLRETTELLSTPTLLTETGVVIRKALSGTNFERYVSLYTSSVWTQDHILLQDSCAVSQADPVVAGKHAKIPTSKTE